MSSPTPLHYADEGSTAVSGGSPSRRRPVEGRLLRKFGGSEGIAKQPQSIPKSVSHLGKKYRLGFVLPGTTTNFNLDRPKDGSSKKGFFGYFL